MSAADRQRIPPRAWLILLLGGCSGMLFYLDRQTLSVLKTVLKGVFGWSDVDYGWLVSAFMLCYTVGYLIAGRVIDRWGTRRTMPLFIGLMSVASVVCGCVHHGAEMAVGRALLGLAESGVVPAVLVAIFTWFPPDRRGTASVVNEPINIAGQILATPFAVTFAALWGWRSAFVAPGVAGIVVALLWWRFDTGAPRPAQRPAAESYRNILRRREIWGVIAARMISDPVWFFLLYWEPGFLQERVGLSLGELGRIGWIPTAVAMFALLFFGVFSDTLIAGRGWAPARSRRVILQALTLGAPAVLVLPFVHNHWAAIGLLCVARTMMVVWLNFSNLFMADLVPQHLIGASVGLMSAFGAAMGLVCNAVVGPAIGRFGYVAIFAVGACLHPLAALTLWVAYGRRRARPPQAEPGSAGCAEYFPPAGTTRPQ